MVFAMTLDACSGCGDSFGRRVRASQLGTAYCRKLECQRERNRIRMRAFYAERPGYYRKYSVVTNAKHQAERRAGLRPSKRVEHAESYKAGDQLRRARKRGVECERFSSREIFERDGWRCGICEHTVDSKLRYPNPRSASLDHVIPLSKGGGHTRSNTRCSHLECNVRRGNQLDDAA